MANTSDPATGTSAGAKPAVHGAGPADTQGAGVGTPVGSPLASGSSHATIAGPGSAIPAEAAPPAHPWRKRLVLLFVLIGLGYGAYALIPFVQTAMNTVSTDDAYINGHVTFVAPRVSGQVSRVLVDDNYRVKKGALLVQLDKEPFEDQVAVKKAAVEAAEADLVAAQAQARGLAAQARANRFQLRACHRRCPHPDSQSACQHRDLEEPAGKP